MPTLRSRLSAVLIFSLGLVAPLLRADTPRLANLATRAPVGTGANIMITGFVIGPGPNKTVLLRAVGPGLTTTFGITGVLPDPVLSLYNNSGAQIGTNNDWNSADAATMTTVGAFALTPGSKDAAMVTTLVPGVYTAQVSGNGGGTGLGLLEIYEVGSDPSSSRLLNLSTRAFVGTDSSTMIGGLVLSPGSGTRRLLIRAIGPTLTSLGVSGVLADPTLTVLNSSNAVVATNDDWGTPVGTTALNATTLSAMFAQVGAFALPSGSKDAAFVADFTPGNYTIQVSGVGGSTGVALVEIYDLTAAGSTGPLGTTVPDALYVATLRPTSAATGSTAFGTATIQLTGNGSLATVNVSFSNLSSTEVVAHLKISPAGDYVLALPAGQVTGAQWTFTPTGTYTSAALLSALMSGNIYVDIDSANYPNGELNGTFVQSAGSQAFSVPAAPPAISLNNATTNDAARLLMQATFGPKQSEIDALTNTSLDTWITTQEAMPFTSHRAATVADFNAFGGNNGNITFANRQAAWWKTVVTGPDQLRQRVAFALSELMVVSDVALGQAYTEGLSNYYDILGNGAFGNFRTLLENVTLSPIMGNYLSTVRNAKADPVAGTSPDENYAREVMQLFTVGLNLLQPDGTLKLDVNGLPIPTYDQTVVTQMAAVFTGWSYFSTKTNPSFLTGAADYIDPMMMYPAYHDEAQKTILNGVVIPANQTGAQDLKVALDALFNHPNTAPFVSKQLIQRLVTSNPSPAYVYRVAQVFANDGTGVRGNLGAVVRAILTDYEARSPSLVTNIAYGKLKEPILRSTALLRTFNATPAGGRYSAGSFSNSDVNLDESALRAPTVFNFFHPGYVLPGPVAAAGLVAPEFEITDATFSLDVPNYLRNLIFPSGTPPATLDLSAEQTLSANVPAQLVHLNLVMCGGTMPSAALARITTALNALPTSTTAVERAETAVLLFATSPAGALQK
jgi:uncharacterized protein (DUF1800 family)